MPAFSVRDLRSQFDRAKRLGWLPSVADAARAHGHEPWDLLAIGSRESNLDPKYLRITGDNGNGFGPWQVDKRYFPEWTRSGKWRDAQEAAEKGAEVLAAKRQEVLDSRGKQRTVTSRSGQRATFTGGAFTVAELRLIAFAAYNSGLWAYYHHTKSGDPDRGTTGKDYSRDVDARSRIFRQLWQAWEADDTDDLAASPPTAIVSGGETPPSPVPPMPAGEGAPVAPHEPATGPEPATLPMAAVPGGEAGAVAQKVTAGSGSWARQIVAWISTLFGAASGYVRDAFGLTPEIQRWLLVGVVVLGVVWLVSKLIAERQVREIASDVSKVTVK
jgi:hypothetical protein